MHISTITMITSQQALFTKLTQLASGCPNQWDEEKQPTNVSAIISLSVKLSLQAQTYK